MIALLFPGQGSQAQGMGRTLSATFPSAQRTFEEADEALGFPISRLCFEGTEEDLRRTEVTQPAILTTCLALHRVLSEVRPTLSPAFAAGHSLGEWSALVAAGALDFRDAVRLVRERGRLMQEAVPAGQGAMAAVLGLAPETVQDTCRRVEAEMQGAVVSAANFNSTDQTVISGTRPAVDAAARALKEAGASKVIELPVSAPFHSPLMAKAATGLEVSLAPIRIRAFAYPIVTNVEARPNSDPERVKRLLIQQVTAPVRWVEIIRFLVGQGVTTALEIGPGRVLAGLARRIDRTMKVHNVEDETSLAKALEALPS